MLLHDSVINLMNDLDAVVPEGNRKSTPSSQQGMTLHNLFSSINYGWDMLEAYDASCRNQVMEIGGGSIRVHSVPAGALRLDLNNTKLLALYLVQNYRDIFENMPADYPQQELIEDVTKLIDGMFVSDEALASFSKTHSSLRLRKNGLTAALSNLIYQYSTIVRSTVRPSDNAPADQAVLHHLFYCRGTQAWAVFMTVGTAKYSLFFHRSV